MPELCVLNGGIGAYLLQRVLRKIKGIAMKLFVKLCKNSHIFANFLVHGHEISLPAPGYLLNLRDLDDVAKLCKQVWRCVPIF